MCVCFFLLVLHKTAHGQSHKLHSIIALSSRDKKRKKGLFVQAGNKSIQNISAFVFSLNAYVYNLGLPSWLSGKESTC